MRNFYQKKNNNADKEVAEQRINCLLHQSIYGLDRLKKVHDFVHSSWINGCKEFFRITNNIRNILKKSVEQWKSSLTCNGEDLKEVDLKRGIFQGDSLSMVFSSLILSKVKVSYEWGKKKYKLNHLLFMNDLKLSEEQIHTLVYTVHIFSTNIGIECGMKKYGILPWRERK